jgi:chromosome segregation ATPase
VSADSATARPSPAEAAARQRKLNDAQAAADAAAGTVSATEAALHRHEQEVGDCAAREAELSAQLEALRAQLAQTETEAADVRRRREDAERQRAQAASADADAHEALDRARAALDALREDGAATDRPAPSQKGSAR